MNKEQLRKLAQKTLIEIGFYTPESLNLVLGTIAQESRFGHYIEQIKGPAKGICQMEPNTYDDIWNNYLKYKPELKDKVLKLSVTADSAEEMVWNLKLAIAMCRVHYLRVKEAIPFGINEQAKYYKKYYNTHLGAATTQQYIDNYKKYVI